MANHKKKRARSVDWRPSGFSIWELRSLLQAGCRLDPEDRAKLKRDEAMRKARQNRARQVAKELHPW